MDSEKGLILSFYLDGKFKELEQSQEFPFLSWSPYDRLEIESIEKFDDFFQSQFQLRWEGVAQQMHLIPEYPENFPWQINQFGKDITNKNVLIRTVKSDCIDEHMKNEYGLNCVITTRFSQYVNNTKKFRNYIYKKLEEEFINKFEDYSGFDWIACNSLGAEDIVFIILANDIMTIGKFVNIIKQVYIEFKSEKIDLFSSISSFVGFNVKDYNNNPGADLIIRLNCGSEDKCKIVIDELKSNGILETDIHKLLLGKCILDVSISAFDDILSYFHGNGIFNGDSVFYKNNIISSRSYWVVKQDDTPAFLLDLDDTDILEFEIIEKDVTPLDYGNKEIPLVQFILKEYTKMIKSRNTIAWKPILKKQYEVVGKLIKEYSEHSDTKALYQLLKQTQNVLLHIKQATTPVAEVPYHNYTYAGSYNDILKMYYGVISSLLKLGYEMYRTCDTNQYEIVFCVDFESTQDLHSNMYCSSDSTYNKRFVIFHLPFEAFTNVKSTVQYLAHEVFHYIAPYSRKERNRTLLIIWSKSVLNRLTKTLSAFGIEKDMIENVIKGIEQDETLNDEIYDNAKNAISGFDNLIINQFYQKGKIIYGVCRLSQNICRIYLDRIYNNNIEVFRFIYKQISKNDYNQKEISNGDDSLFSKVYSALDSEIQTDISYNYYADDMINVALATKEAFCDINMIKIFNLSLNQYLKLFYELYLKKIVVKNEKIFDEINYVERGIKMGSREKRMGIVFDMFCGTDNYNDSYEKFKQLINLREKDEDALFDEFRKYCCKCYAEYLKSDNLLRKTYRKLNGETISYWDENMNNLSLLSDIRKSLILDHSIKSNIDFISTFISKKEMVFSVSQNNRLCNNVIYDSYSNNSTFGSYNNIAVTTIGEYVDAICRIAEKMQVKSMGFKQVCWYRGVCDKEFSLLPGLYRQFDGNSEVKIGMSPYALQSKILKDAYFETLSTPMMWTEQIVGIMEHTCCIQHYGLSTSLLDFSLDMLVALHFALNPDVPRDREMVSCGYYKPKVVVFNPVKYSKAIISLTEGHVCDVNKNIPFSPVMFDICDKGMESFFVNDMSAEYTLATTRKFFENEYVPNRRIDRYPKPIIIRQSNSRILAQNGIFLAFDLHAQRDVKTKNFDYLDLKAIQESYLQLIGDKSRIENEKFLEEVYIEPVSVDGLRRELEVLGVTMPKIYPELDKIFKYQKDL